jgi:uncharacterized protein (DUF608 family)
MSQSEDLKSDVASGTASCGTSRTAQRFHGDFLTQIALPLGGLGAGSVSFNGHGGLQDWAIRHRPHLSALPDGHGFDDAFFALLRTTTAGASTSSSTCRLVEGPLPWAKVYAQGLQGQGFRHGGFEGLPRFGECEWEGEFPFGRAILSDASVPLRVQVEGWSPFVPRDDTASGAPCAILNYTLHNPTGEPVEYELSLHLSHLACGRGKAEDWKRTRTEPFSSSGAWGWNTWEPDSEHAGTCALLAMPPGSAQVSVKSAWFRGEWFDAFTHLWRECAAGEFGANEGSGPNFEHAGRNGMSVLVRGTLAPGEEVVIPAILAWHFPLCAQSFGAAQPGPWRPFYAGVWEDARAVASWARDNYGSLLERTRRFSQSLYNSTLPTEALDAIGANLSILKSPTVLRQENGNVWGWEGCFAESGCCHGTCTHVWNYAQALPHLFPALERTLREQELERSLRPDGHASFRAALPDGAPNAQWNDFHGAADGQLGGILKLWRDWQISGDDGWLSRLWPPAQKSLDWCIETWDPDGRGVLCEPHHNTYDIEFWGPDGMCSSIYLAALGAGAALAEHAGDSESAGRYSMLAARGSQYLDEHIWNGEYFEQRVEWEGLREQGFARSIAPGNLLAGEDPQVLEVLRREGPKYQYGAGCLSDGVIGAWMAQLYGCGTSQNRERVRENLRAIFTHNFRADLSGHANTQRPGYALGSEAGLVVCTWPRGARPVFPFPYADEVFTGIEYQVASHLILEGMLEEGLAIVRGVRSRYDGRVRNPWNEYECGNFYARALSSYALLQSLSGFRYFAPSKTLEIAPQVSREDFRCFFSTAGAWGTVALRASTCAVRVEEGALEIEKLVLNGREFEWKTRVEAGQKGEFAAG